MDAVDVFALEETTDMSTRAARLFCGCVVAAVSVAAQAPPAATPPADPRPTQFRMLFPVDGPVTKGWSVRTWADIKDQPRYETVWHVRDGILHGGKSPTGRWVGTWLFSEEEYGDFVLEVDFKFRNGGAQGNGGVGLRVSPLAGRPSYDAMELQITDPRYEYSLYRNGTSDQLTGSIYKAISPIKQVYNPGEWNTYRIDARGSRLKVWLNSILVQDVDLDTVHDAVEKHEGGQALPLSKRPRRGHIGFQDLSNPGEQLLFRNARIAVLD
jgi:hypothetical protein